ncbi:MAG: HAMP domain-containing protein [Proteobacteria bacterium]|jgi:adenylate cyclase|nr:HAMP domain-containing protein [Pseudomonadota bacterium]
MRIPISFKLIFLTVSFLVVSTVLFIYVSSLELTTTMVLREEDANKSQAKARANDVDNLLTSAKERTEINAALLLKDQSSEDLKFNFEKDKSLVALEIFLISSTGNTLTQRKWKEEYFKENKIEVTHLEQILKNLNFPFLSVAQKKIEVRNATLPKGPTLFVLGLPLMKDENGSITHIALAYYKLSYLQKPFTEVSERIYYLADRQGTLLAHQLEDKALARLSFRTSPIMQQAMSGDLPEKQSSFEDPEDGETYIGAFVKNLAFGVIVVSQIKQSIVLEPAKNVKREAIKIAGYMISVALFLIFLFSMTLTSPIERLAEMIQHVARGNFDIKARKFVRSKDEVGDLAIAFDKMTEGLKERDKVKSLFSKFHGSSVAEDLLKNDIGVGGQNKEVTVFFSDIRGFTAFSEKRTPEEVVTMLNEYFEVMVGIINRHGGVVDKFIGDAIMAVWGAPNATDRDTQSAVRACLEMRKALVELNQRRESRGQPPIMIGMGLHSGRAISGTIGSSERMEYTVIGDTVNMTSRIESSTKAFGADLLVSETVSEKVAEEFLFEEAGSAEVKGKSEPLKLFKVRGYKEHGQWVEITTPFSDYEKSDADKVKVA